MYVARERSDQRKYKVIAHSLLSFERPGRKMDYDVVRIVGKGLSSSVPFQASKYSSRNVRTSTGSAWAASIFPCFFGTTRNGRAIGGKYIPQIMQLDRKPNQFWIRTTDEQSRFGTPGSGAS